MNDWDRTPGRGGFGEQGRRDVDWRERDIRERELRDRRPGEGRHFGPPGRGRRDNQADYNPEVGPYAAGGDAAQGYGEGGDTAYGQMTRGGSDTAGGGYGGANVGGWGQSGLTSQWGQGGYGPLNTGLQYGQDGGRFGPQGYAEGDFGPARHDRDYGHWRNEQARRYDEDYHAWRTERHSAFSKEFEGWRTGRGGQATTPAPDANATHGANPTLSKIADGHEGRTLHPHHADADKDKASDHN